MIKNYIKIAFRNLFKHKLYSFINIFGLAVGIACCVLIMLYVQNEWSFDEFHSNSDRLYRTWVYEKYENGDEYLNITTPLILASTLENNIPEIEQVSRVYSFSTPLQTADDEEALFASVFMVDPAFFIMFDFELIQGNRHDVMNNPQSVVLTTDAVEFYFGDEDPMQKVIDMQIGSEAKQFVVAGVAKNTPANSSLDFDVVIPFSNAPSFFSDNAQQSWFNVYVETYVMLNEGAEAGSLDQKFISMMQQVLGDRYEESNYEIGLQPLADVHLNMEFGQGIANVSDPIYSYILAAVAFLILAIACINFMTLSISKSSSRAKEVGIRKTIGALRRHLMYQFWGEALLMTTLALGLGIMFAEILLPFFNDLSGTSLQLQMTPLTVAVMFASTLVVSLVAGIYPALILSGFQPMEVLKGRLSLSADKNLFLKTMVVFQFSLSIALIIGTIIVQRQLNYVQNKDLGYQKDEIVVLESGLSTGPQTPLAKVIENSFQRKQLLQNQINAIPEVSGVAVSSFTPIQMNGWFKLGFSDDQDQTRAFHGNIVDADFIPTLGIKLIQGRNFSDEKPSDKRRAIIVNQALVDYFGWKNPLGQRLPGPEFNEHEVIGVVENFNYESLHTPVEPLAMAMSPDVLFSGINNMSVSNSASPRYSLKISSADLSATMANIRQSWEQIAPGTPFDFTFVDQALDNQYRQERRLSRIVTSGSILAIVIACLGLFGLASLMITRRTKEIGVRKVLGASASSIVLLVNKEFTKLIVIAFVLAAPVAWYVMNQWLQDFAYKVDISLWVYLLAGVITLLVAGLTVSYQSLKATMVNPVDSLRSE